MDSTRSLGKLISPAIEDLNKSMDIYGLFDCSVDEVPNEIGILIRNWIPEVEVRVVNSVSQANNILQNDSA